MTPGIIYANTSGSSVFDYLLAVGLVCVISGPILWWTIKSQRWFAGSLEVNPLETGPKVTLKQGLEMETNSKRWRYIFWGTSGLGVFLLIAAGIVKLA
jgi:hypothetical protein